MLQKWFMYYIVQVNLFQKPSFLHQLTHNMTRDCSLNSPEKYKFRTNCVQFFLFCFDIQNNTLTIIVHNMFWLVFFGEFDEQSLVILWVNLFKNESFWHRFTCTVYIVNYNLTQNYAEFVQVQNKLCTKIVFCFDIQNNTLWQSLYIYFLILVSYKS